VLPLCLSNPLTETVLLVKPLPYRFIELLVIVLIYCVSCFMCYIITVVYEVIVSEGSVECNCKLYLHGRYD
jgi:hypothetical protein